MRKRVSAISIKAVRESSVLYEKRKIENAGDATEFASPFFYEYGLEPKLIHRPAFEDRGEVVYFYGIFRTVNGGYGFSVMSKIDMDIYAKTYSKGFDSAYSPWRTSYEEMAKKTVIKQALKYAPIKSDLQKALSTDGSIKKSISVDMAEVNNEIIDYTEVA